MVFCSFSKNAASKGNFINTKAKELPSILMHGTNIIYLGFTKSSKAPAVSHLSKEGRTNLNLSETSSKESTNLDQMALSQSLFLTEDPYPEKNRKNKPEKSNILFIVDVVKKATSKRKNCSMLVTKKDTKKWPSPLTSVLTWPTT